MSTRVARIRSLVILGLTLPLVAPAVAFAHSPTGSDREYSPDNAAEEFYFGAGTSALSWFIVEVEPALETNWNTSNNTRAPHFTRTSVDGAEIKYRTNAETPFSDECPDTFWYACTDYYGGASATTWMSTTFNREDPSGPLLSLWCQFPGQGDSGCADVRRVAIHEAGHGVGLARQSNGHVHQTDSQTSATTVMQTNPKLATAAGWLDRFLGSCDLIELAREYDVVSFSQALPACVDHITAPATSNVKVVTVASQTTTATGVCVGIGVTLSGSLRLTNQPADDQLGLLASNGIGGRTVEIFRRTSSGGYPSTPYTTTTVGTSEAGSWSKSVVSTTSGTWIFQARYAPGSSDLSTLNASTSLERTITWSSPC
ncbi:MAG: hypothetical protein V4515_02760 [Chloroflexota bacterium]